MGACKDCAHAGLFRYPQFDVYECENDRRVGYQDEVAPDYGCDTFRTGGPRRVTDLRGGVES
jgi:hypothetical protein